MMRKSLERSFASSASCNKSCDDENESAERQDAPPRASFGACNDPSACNSSNAAQQELDVSAASPLQGARKHAAGDEAIEPKALDTSYEAALDSSLRAEARDLKDDVPTDANASGLLDR
jgi:hypothetical protein